MSRTRLNPRSRLAAAVATVVTAAVALLALVAPAGAAGSCTAEAGWGASRTDLAAQVVELANAYRAEKGLPQLSGSSTLTASATWKSLHMAGNGYFEHDDPPPVSRGAYQRAKDCGFAGTTWGENIAYGYTSARAVMAGWIGSPGHRANLENPSFTTIGVGVAETRSGTLYWTQNFGNDTASSVRSVETRSPASPQVRQSARAGRARGGTVLLGSIEPLDRATGRRFAAIEIACRAEIEGARLAVVVHTARQGRPTCGWVVPTEASGKTLTASITARGHGSVAVATFTRPVD